jgi:hypothetical protein
MTNRHQELYQQDQQMIVVTKTTTTVTRLVLHLLSRILLNILLLVINVDYYCYDHYSVLLLLVSINWTCLYCSHIIFAIIIPIVTIFGNEYYY